MRKVLVLLSLLLCVSVGVSGKAAVYSNIDTLVQKVNSMWVENPAEAKLIATQIANQAKVSNDNVLRARAYMARSKVSQAFGLDVEALNYIDSALTLAAKLQNTNLLSEVLLRKLSFCNKANNDELVRNTLQNIDDVVKNNQDITLEVRKLLLIGDFSKQKSNINDAIKYKEQALQKSLNLANDTLVAECQQSIGSVYWYFGSYKQALENYSEALVIREQLQLVDGIIDVLKNIGLTYRSLGQFDAAYQNYSRALDLAVEEQDRVEEATILNLMGGLNLSCSKIDEALENFEASYAIFDDEKMIKSGVATLQNIARTYTKKSSFDIALRYLDDALLLQEQLVDPISESSILNEKGNLYLQKGDITGALKNYLMSLKIRKKCGDNELVAKSLMNIGIAYRRLGMLGNAAKYLEQVVELVNGHFIKPADAAYAMQNLAHIYSDQKRYDTAISTYKSSLLMVEQIGDELQESRILCNIAQTQIKNGQLDEAKASLNQSLRIAIKKDSKSDIANIYNELGNVERAKANYQQAIVFYQKSAELYKIIQNDNGLALCLRKIGEAQVDMGNYSDAEKNINESIGIGIQIGNQYLLQYGYYAKYQMYNARGAHKNALAFYIKYVEVKDSIQSYSKNEKSIEAQIDLELDQKTTEIKLMEAEMEALKTKTELDKERLARESMVRNFLLVLIVLGVIIVGILVIAFIQKRRHARVLEEKIVEINLVNNKLVRSEKELKETIQSKDKLFSIVAHDLRSPFTALVGLTEIMANQSDQCSKAEMADFSKLVNNSAENVLSLIDNLLHWSRSQTGRIVLNPMNLSFLDIVNSVIPTAQMAAAAKKIELLVQVEPQLSIWADSDTIIAVIRNLVSNAIKFTPENGSIKIVANKLNNNVVIKIIDNGVGISKANLEKLFKVDGVTTKGTNNEGGTGLGLLVCKEFVEKNGGTIAVDSTVGKGTVFTIELKTA